MDASLYIQRSIHDGFLNYSIFTRVQKTGYISVRDGSFAFIGLLFL